MSFQADPRYLRGRGLEADFSVAIEADDGSWAELNYPAPASPKDYWGCLLVAPSVSVKTQDDLGIAVTSVSDLVLDNAPWKDARAGFWDSVLPVTVRGKIISARYRRKMRLAFNVLDPIGEGYSEAVALGVYRIDDIKTTGGRATIKLISLDRAWDEVSAESVLDGTEPYRGATISALIKRLIKAADPGADLSGIPDELEMPLMDSALACSLGPCPNIATASGERSVHHWIPRCARLDQFVADQTVYVGFEVPGANQRSDGAIAAFNVKTAHWTVVVWPSQLAEYVPHLLYPGSSSTLYFWVYQDQLADSSPLGLMREYSVPKAGGTPSAVGSAKPAWQSRYLVRNGCARTGDQYWIGTPWNYEVGAENWYGEPMMLPFLQMLTWLGEYVFAPGVFDWDYSEVAWNGYGSDGDGQAPRWDMQLRELIGQGNISLVLDDADSTWPLFRFFAAWTWHQPQTRVVNSTMNTFWVGQGETSNIWKWRIYQQRISDGYINTWTLDGLGETYQFLVRQITAWCLGIYASGTVTVLLAVIKWNETVDSTGPPWGDCSLYKVTFDGSGGGAATCTEVWTVSPGYTDTDVPIIVRLWSRYKLTATYGQQPHSWAVAVIMNRSTMASPMYGLGIWDQNTDTWIERFHDASVGYTGPTSGSPFDGFAADPSDVDTFRFIDQATGQIWKAVVNAGSLTVTWTIENDGFPVTSSEFALASPDGLSLLLDGIADQPETYWWTAPGKHGDTLCAEYAGLSSASVLFQPGDYHMVRLGRRLSDTVDTADFTGLSVWKAILKLMARALLYDRYIDGDGRLVLQDVNAEPSGPTIVFEELAGPAVLQSGEIPAAGIPTKSERYKAAANTVEIVPWRLQRAAVPDPTRITGAGSQFAGDFLAQIVTSAAVSVSLTCVAGGDINDMMTDPSEIQSMKQAALLFAWKTLIPETHGYLVTACAALDLAANVGGLVARADRFWCGSVEIRVGDRARIGASDWHVITALASASTAGNFVTVTFGEAIMAGAGVWADVTFEPTMQSSLSNGELGIAMAPSGLGSGETSLTVDDNRAIKRWMVLQACYAGLPSEYLYVERIEQDGQIQVMRAMFGTTAQTWPAGTVLKGLVWMRQQGKLYEVGNTGVLAGVTMSQDPSLEVDPGSNLNLGDKSCRTVLAGDGLIITADGSKLAKLTTGVVKAIDQAALSNDGNQTKSRKVDDNPFIDPVFAHGYAPALLGVLAPMLTSVSGVDIPLTPGITPASRLFIDDASLFPAATSPVAFRPTAIQYNLAEKRMRLDLISIPGDEARDGLDPWYYLLWTRTFPDACFSTWEITDLDPGDGHEDLIGLSWDNTLWVLDPATGAVVHSYNPGTTVEANGYGFVSCVDVNADGVKEIIWGSHDGYVRCMSADLATVLWSVRDWYTRNSESAPSPTDQFFPNGPTPALAASVLTLYQTGHDGRVLAIRASDGTILNEYNANG